MKRLIIVLSSHFIFSHDTFLLHLLFFWPPCGGTLSADTKNDPTVLSNEECAAKLQSFVNLIACHTSNAAVLRFYFGTMWQLMWFQLFSPSWIRTWEPKTIKRSACMTQTYISLYFKGNIKKSHSKGEICQIMAAAKLLGVIMSLWGIDDKRR